MMDGSARPTISVRPSSTRNVTPVPFSYWRRDIWLHSVIVLFVLAYCVSTIALSRPSGFNTFWDGGVYTVAEMLPVIAMLMCALRWPAQRAPWLFIGAGVLAHTAGDLVYSFHDQNLVPTPVPASSDYVYFASYALLVIGVVLLTQRNVGRVRAAVRVEGIVVGIAVAALAALLWFGPVFSATGSLWHVVTADVYPVGNLVLLVLLVSSLAPYEYQPNVPVILLLGAVAWFVFGDVMYFSQSVNGTFVSRTLLNATWVIGLWLVALAATAVDRRRSGALRRKRPVDQGVTWALFAAASVCVAVLVSCLVVPGIDTASLVLACVGLLLVSLAIIMAKRDLARVTLEPDNVDVVTGLMTSVLFREQVEAMLAERDSTLVGVVVLDIVNFSEVNDAIGYLIADELLWVIARRAEHRLGDGVIFARLEGDRFASAVRACSKGDVDDLAESVRSLSVDRFRLSGLSVGVVGRVGVAMAAPGTTNAAHLLVLAESALEESGAPPHGIEP
jgi:diguanylate cyclase (GGDEF)-like protein